MKLKIFICFLFASTLFLSGCGQNEDDWIDLLSSDNQSKWRGYNGETLPPGWTVSDDMLWYDTDLQLEQDYSGGRDVIYGGEEFEYFELSVEWKIPEGGNSGIFYHVQEGFNSPSGTSPEYQLIDDEKYADIHDLVGYNSQFGAEHPELLQDWQLTGADYAMHPVEDPSAKVLHPTGEWNQSKIVVRPGLTEHWLNGIKLLSFEPGSQDWHERKAAGKWADAENYGKFKTGYIGFQDHGSSLWFRNIKIRPLK